MFVDDFGKFSHATTANESLRDEAPTFDFMEFFVDLSFFTLIGTLKQANTFITTTHSQNLGIKVLGGRVPALLHTLKLSFVK